MCKKQIDWRPSALANRIKVSWRTVEAVAVAGWWAFAPAASCSLCSPVSHLLSLVTRSRNQLALRQPLHFSLATTAVCALLSSLQSTNRWPIDPTSLKSRPLPLCCCFRTRIRPTFATAAASRTLAALDVKQPQHFRCP